MSGARRGGAGDSEGDGRALQGEERWGGGGTQAGPYRGPASEIVLHQIDSGLSPVM